jgi:hypothetical protein
VSFDLPKWLIEIGLPQYVELFLSQGFDGPGLASLNDADLRELGIAAMGHRKTILREAASLALPRALVLEPDQFTAVAPLLPVQPMPRGRVFLSYGHDPACVEIVQRIRLDLLAAGWEPWVDDKGIRFGDDWRREITKGIQESQHVLAFLSQHSTRKPGVCRQEVAIALGPRKGHVYTVLVEPLERVSPPLIVSHMQWLDMQQWQELKVNDPAAYESLYRKSLAEILRVLERNEPFAGDIELLQRWLDPLDGTAEMLAAEEGFTGRRWLLDGLVEQPAWKSDDGSEVLSTEAGSGNLAFAGEADQASPAAPVGEIERWRTSGSPNRVFWISAGPGWGKSAVAARLAHAARGRVMAVHYCRYNKPGTRDARQVVRTLAFQMATQLGDYRELLVRQAQQGTVLAELNALELFDKLLANPLAHELGGGRGAHDRHLIVLDALDETLEDDQSELLNLVAGEFGKLPPWLGLVVTSRPEAPVLRQLGAFGVQHQSEDDPRNLQDLRAYVDFWLQGLALEPAQREQALRAVVQASEGMFLYVRQLREAVNSGAVPPTQLTDPASLPKGLAGLYERWFQARFKDDKGQTAYDAWQRPLLELMLAAREPLPVALAHAVLGWGPYGEANALEPLGTLCSQHGGTVSLFHKSLADWLSKLEDSGRRFHVSTAQGHQRLATGLWNAYTQWRDEGAHLQGRTGWQPLGEPGEAYAMRHLPAHLKAVDLLAEMEQTLTDFAFAMKRCAVGAIEALLKDYKDKDLRFRPNDPVGMWARLVLKNAHLLRRAHEGWPTQNLLWQIAAEYADNCPITTAAEQFLNGMPPDGMRTFLRRKVRPLNPPAEDGLQSIIEIGNSLRNTTAVDTLMTLSPSRALLLGGGHALQVDLENGTLHDLELVDLADALSISDERYVTWTHQGTFSVRETQSGRAVNEFDLHAERRRPRAANSKHPFDFTVDAFNQGDYAPTLVERIGSRHIAVCTPDRFFVFDFRSGSIATELRLSYSVDGVVSNGYGRVFFWQGLEKEPAVFDIGDDHFSRVVTEFECASLCGAFFADPHTIVFWAHDDICIYNLNSRSAKYIEIESADPDEQDTYQTLLEVQAHPTRAEILVRSHQRIARYSLDGTCISEVFCPHFYHGNDFQGFAIREDDSFVTWDASATEDFLWSSGSNDAAIVGVDAESKAWKLIVWSAVWNQVLFIDPNGIPRLFDVPTHIDALSGKISQLDKDRIVYFDSGEGRLLIFGIQALYQSTELASSSIMIWNPWLTEQGRLAYLSQEDDLCILFKDKPEVEHVIYGMSVRPEELLVGREQIAVRCDEYAYLYDFSGVLRWRKRVGRVKQLFPAVIGMLISWDSRRICLWRDGDLEPTLLMGMNDHLEDDPISGMSVSPCGQIVAAWNRFGEVHVWNVAAPTSPQVSGIFEKISRVAVCLSDEAVVIAVQLSDGVVQVINEDRLIAAKSFPPDSLIGLEFKGGELIVVFREETRWSPQSNTIACTTPLYEIELQDRAVLLTGPDFYAEWHSTFDIDWASPIGDRHLFVVSQGHGEILNLVSA